MITIRHISAAPKKGFEFEYYLAWKHRQIASLWMNKTMKSFRWWKYNQAERLWCGATDRVHKYGRDVYSRPQI